MLEIKNLSDRSERLKDISINLKKGEILGLVGESGSGKTTIGRAIIRINPVSGGVIAYNNIPISGKINRTLERAIKTKIQMVFQDPSASLNEATERSAILEATVLQRPIATEGAAIKRSSKS